MTIRVRHRFQSAKADGSDSTLVKPSNWNDTHLLETDGAGGVVLGRDTTGPGEIQELPLAYNLAGLWSMAGATGSFMPPSGTTAQRPAGPNGGLRYNSELGQLEAFIGGSWTRLSVASDFASPVPAGAVFTWAGASAPTGYLLCNGAAVSRATYTALFTIIGTTYGAGDGSTTFNVPNLVGRTPAGADPAGTVAGFAAPVGTVRNTGTKSVTIAVANLPAHTHTLSPGAVNGGSGVTGSGNALQDTGVGGNTGSAGSGTPLQFDNYGPTLFMNYIIRH